MAQPPGVAYGSAVDRVIVVGASLAGLRAAESLRSGGFVGQIAMVGAEPHQPYDRPPLSKRLLSGEWEPERIALRKPDELASLDLEWHLGDSAVELDTSTCTVSLASGAALTYDGLVLATGADARRLPGQPDHPRVVMVRTIDDSLALRALIGSGGQRVVVVGAGFIGLEVAATVKGLGNDVTVLEGLPAPLIRGLGADIGSVIGEVHAEHGVEVRCGVVITGVDEGGVTLDTGERVSADVVVVGIGVAPVTKWLEGSGLELRDGIVCDATLNAGVDGVYAAGDVARWYHDLYGEEIRVEHWTTAAEQGAHAATNLLAVSRGEEPQPYVGVPFFWSDQYDRRIQFLGRSAGHDEVRVVAGSTASRQFVALYRQGERLQGVVGLNSPRLLMPYRALLARRAGWDEALAHAAL